MLIVLLLLRGATLPTRLACRGDRGRRRSCERRESFIDLLETVHKVQDKADTFDSCFPGVDRRKLQQEWEDSLGGIEVE